MKQVLAGCMGAIFFFGMLPQTVHAEYVLPYPSYMPGNKIYRVTRIIDRIKKPLYFGSLGRYKYHLSLADKYLVEAKTLFEYRQYLLAVDALERSDREFASAAPYVSRGMKEGKDMRIYARNLQDASDVHISVLENLKEMLPASFEWRPEKTSATNLRLADMLDVSVALRKTAQHQVQKP